MNKIALLVLYLASTPTQGFVVPGQRQQFTPSVVQAAKGFGSKEPPPSPKNTQSSPPVVESSSSSVPPPVPFPQVETSDLSEGKAALERMRRERAELRNAELRKVKEVQDVDAMLRESPEAAAIPEKVAQRMGSRMLPFVGIPLLGGMGIFVGFWYMATYRDLEFEPALVAASTIAVLVVGLVGITYSIMSASWDPDREGSLVGTDEFATNLENIKQGLSRSRENAVLRDKMSDYSPEEIAAIDQKGGTKAKRQQSFSQKLGDDME